MPDRRFIDPRFNPTTTHRHPDLVRRASRVPVTDAEGHFDGDNVEDVLEELADAIAAVTSPTAADVSVTDSGGFYTGTDAEAVLAEIGTTLAGIATAGWFNVKAYGATGDGSTDDTTAINAAIAALASAGRGVLYFPAGTYVTAGALTTLSVPCLVLGDGGNNFDGDLPGSLVTCTSATANLFTVTAEHAKFSNIAFRNDAGSTPSAGSAVTTQGTHLEQRVDFDSVTAHGFWINFDVQVGGQWSMRGCQVIDPVKYGVKIRNTVNGDAGDWALIANTFNADSHAADAAIRIESSGGGKIIGNKLNMGFPVDEKFVNGIDVAVTTGISTVILLIAANSIENVTGHGISITSAGTGQWRHFIINGNQFGLWGNNSGKAIWIAPTNTNDVEDILISSNVFHTNGTARSAVQLTNTDNVILSSNLLSGFDDLYDESGSTNIVVLGAGSTPSAHATTHEDGGSDEIEITNLPTTETDTDLRLAPDGSGGVEFVAGGGAPTAAQIAALGFVGPVLIADGASVPFDFTDALQADGVATFVYADL